MRASLRSRIVLAVLAAVALSLVRGVGAPDAHAADGCLLVVTCPPAPTPTTAPPVPPVASAPVPAAAPMRYAPSVHDVDPTGTLLALLNHERAAHGLASLALRTDVASIAQVWSGRMAASGALSHDDAYFAADTRGRLRAGALGENVARNSSVGGAHAALMASPHHRANILDARFRVVGIGAVEDGGSWWITEDFVQPLGAPAASSTPAPTPAPRPVRKAPVAAPARARTIVPPTPAPPPPAAVAAPAPPVVAALPPTLATTTTTTSARVVRPAAAPPGTMDLDLVAGDAEDHDGRAAAAAGVTSAGAGCIGLRRIRRPRRPRAAAR